MRLFVYGSLKRGFSNHAFLRGQCFLGVARTQPGYYLHDCGGYPGALPAPHGEGLHIEGELWEIDPECQTRIEWLEGTNAGIYRLAPCALEGEACDEEYETWIYLYAQPTDQTTQIGPSWPRERDIHEPEIYPQLPASDQL